MHRLLLALLACALISSAQSNRSSIGGRVQDSTGLPVGGAKIRLQADAIGLVRASATNEQGVFLVGALPPATYRIFVEHPGFQQYERTAIEIFSDDRVSLSIALSLGELSQTVRVEAASPLVDTTSGDTVREITGAQLQNMSLAGRYSYMMLGLLPGVAARGGAFLSDFRSTSVSMGGLQINGQRKETNFISIDGVSNTQLRSGVSMNQRVGVDFVEEVKVLTTHYSPELGRSSGTHINFVTRRGTREWHGSAYEILANNALNARAFLTGTKNVLRYHNPGWTLGGPVLVPGGWNKSRSKLFFFAGQEFRRLNGFNEQTAVVPTLAERALNFQASAQRPVDPLNSNQPFPGNIIPESRRSPFGAALLKLYPPPNFAGPGGNFVSSRKQPIQSDDLIVRLDYNISPRWQLSGRVMRSVQQVTSPYSDTSNRVPLFDITTAETGYNAGGSLVTTINATTTNEAVIGFASRRENYEPLGSGYTRAAYGLTIPEVYPGNRLDRIPTINISGFTTLSGSLHPTYFYTPSWIFRDNFSKVARTHALKAGFYYERMAMNDITRANDNGSFTFGASAQNPLSSRSPLANAMLGIFDSYAEDSASFLAPYRATVLEFYVQDTWRLRPRFSLEYGVRYAIIPPWRSETNTLSAFFPSAWDPAKAPRVSVTGAIEPNTGDVFNGITIPGSKLPAEADPAASATVRGKPQSFFPTDYKNIQPRLSFAWSLDSAGKTAIRGGGGVFRGFAGLRDSGFQLASNPPFLRQASINNGLAANPASGVLATTQFPINITAFPDRFPLPLVVNYSLGIQRQLPGSTLLDISYIGGTGNQILRSRPLNFLLPAAQAANQGRDLRALFPYRGLGNLNLVEPAANSLYSSLQVMLRRRMHRSFSYSVAYTLAKNIGYTYQGLAAAPQDPTNYAAERSEIQESRRHYAVVNGSYDLPFFPAQRGVAGRLLGGWQVSAAATMGTGRLYTAALTSATRQIATRPDVVRNSALPSSDRGPFRWFDTTAFARPAAFTFGNAGNNTIRGPGVSTVDAFVVKNFRLVERVNLQYRAEIFNLLNHPIYTELSTTLGASNFGQVTGAASARVMQMGLKLVF